MQEEAKIAFLPGTCPAGAIYHVTNGSTMNTSISYWPVARLRRVLRAFSGTALLALLLSASVAAQTPGRTLPLADRPMTAVGAEASTLGDLVGPSGLVVAFWSNSCPWVQKNEARFVALANDFGAKGIGFVVVNANDPNAYPDETPAALAAQVANGKYTFPYLIDAEAALAKALGAQRTPEIFVFNANRVQVYAGAIDDSPALADNVTTPYLKAALDALVAGQAVAQAATKSIGCTIKFP